MRLILHIWRQKNPSTPGKMVRYEMNNANPDMSMLECLDVLNEDLMAKGEEPVAFVVPRSDNDVSGLADDLAVRCAERLSRFRRPAEIVIVDSLPLGTNGKVRHAELRRELANASTGESAGENSLRARDGAA